MSSIEVKTFDNPDESNTSFNNAKMDIVKIGDQRVMRLTLQPGWKWSQDIKPTVGTDSCKAKHLGVIVSGAVCAKHDDGTELTYKAGDAYSNQYLLRYNRLQERENQRLLYVDNKGLLVSCSCFVLFYRLVIQYTQEVVF